MDMTEKVNQEELAALIRTIMREEIATALNDLNLQPQLDALKSDITGWNSKIEAVQNEQTNMDSRIADRKQETPREE